MTPRERVLKAIEFAKADRLPKDLGGMASTGISAFAYPKLVQALGLPPRRPRVYDTWQMLAFPDVDVLDALGCDVVAVDSMVTNAFEEPEKWHDYDFNGRLPARVQDPSAFAIQADGTILQQGRGFRMPPTSFVFDAEHGGQPLILTGELPKDDLGDVKRQLEEARLTDERIREIRDFCRRVRESTDRAVFYSGPIRAGIGIAARGGIAVFPVLCLLEPDYIRELHEMVTDYSVRRIEALLPEIAPYVDILMLSADDWGTQNSLIASPDVYRDLFLPYHRKVNGACHRAAPGIKTFLHCCGAVYDLIDLIIEGGFDILNPVQWPAGGHSYKEWKEKSRGRIALWGGGVNAQATLALGSVEEVEKEAREVTLCLASGSGYVFNSIHNLLAETDPEKVIAMYRAAGRS